MQPRPSIYNHILVLGGGAIPRIGGIFAQPDVGLSYLLAARHVIEAGETERRLAEVALPAAYLQRHAMESALKALLAVACGIRRAREWLDALLRDANAESPAVESVPHAHHFKDLRRLVRRALGSIDRELPDELADLTKKLAEAEMFDHTRFKYLTLVNGDDSFPKSEVLRVAENQEELELVFERHLHFEGFDRPSSEWNLVTTLAGDDNFLSQRIAEIVPLERR